MDKYYFVDKYARKTNYYLNFVEHEPMDENGTLPQAKSIVSFSICLVLVFDIFCSRQMSFFLKKAGTDSWRGKFKPSNASSNKQLG